MTTDNAQPEAERLAILMNDSIETAIVAEGIKGTPILRADVSIPWRDAMIAAAGQVLREDRHHLIRWMYSEAERLRVIPDGMAGWQAVNRQKTANSLIAVIAHLSVAEMLGPPAPIATITVRDKNAETQQMIKHAESVTAKAISEQLEAALPPGAHPDSPGVKEMFERGQRDGQRRRDRQPTLAQLHAEHGKIHGVASSLRNNGNEGWINVSEDPAGEVHVLVSGTPETIARLRIHVEPQPPRPEQHTIDCRSEEEGGCVGHV